MWHHRLPHPTPLHPQVIFLLGLKAGRRGPLYTIGELVSSVTTQPKGSSKLKGGETLDPAILFCIFIQADCSQCICCLHPCIHYSIVRSSQGIKSNTRVHLCACVCVRTYISHITYISHFLHLMGYIYYIRVYVYISLSITLRHLCHSWQHG